MTYVINAEEVKELEVIYVSLHIDNILECF